MQTRFQDKLIEAGCDEAGRGCLAGPVFAAAVVFPNGYSCDLIQDSKSLSHKGRLKVRSIIEKEALAFAVSMVEPLEIDKINILNASILAMHKALASLQLRPGYIIVDGNRFKSFQDIAHSCIVKGDSKYQSIAAASILAKTYRDEYMEKIAVMFPQYQWTKNKGYPTADHRKAIKEYGACIHHRKTFKLLADEL